MVTRTARHAIDCAAAMLCAAVSACTSHDANPQRAQSSQAHSPRAVAAPATPTRGIDISDTNIGLAEARHGDDICLAIPVTLPIGAAVTLVLPGASTALPAQVASVSAGTCVTDSTGVGVQQHGDSLYILTLAGATVEPGLVYIAVAASVEHFQVRGDTLYAQVGPTGVALSFRACASAEGVHFTAWRGAPLSGQRVWHRYYYLGYDTEPSCTKTDYEEPRPDPQP